MAQNHYVGEVVYITCDGEEKVGRIVRISHLKNTALYAVELANKDVVFRCADGLKNNERSEWLSAWRMAFEASGLS